MLKAILIALVCAFLGNIPLMGVPGALLMYSTSPFINLLYGPLAFEAWLRGLSSNSWSLSILLSLLWPLMIPIAYYLSIKLFPENTFWTIKKTSLMLAVIVVGSVIIANVFVLIQPGLKHLNQSETFVEAVYANKKNVINKLINSGFKVETLSTDPLYIAITNFKYNIASHLISYRNNVKNYLSPIGDKSHQAASPLHAATAHGQIDLMEEILKKGANPNLPDSKGQTAIHLISYASKNKGSDLKLLLKYGASATNIDKMGDTPLISYTKTLNSWSELPLYAQILIEAGINPNHKNNEGKKAIDYARDNHHTTTVKFLEKIN